MAHNFANYIKLINKLWLQILAVYSICLAHPTTSSISENYRTFDPFLLGEDEPCTSQYIWLFSLFSLAILIKIIRVVKIWYISMTIECRGVYMQCHDKKSQHINITITDFYSCLFSSLPLFFLDDFLNFPHTNVMSATIMNAGGQYTNMISEIRFRVSSECLTLSRSK